jgi:hypothetical protein
MIRKEKSKKRQHFHKKEGSDIRLRHRPKELKQKYRHFRVWIDENETEKEPLYTDLFTETGN